MLVEDEPVVRDVIAEMLTADGHVVIQTAGGREGLARLEAGERVDLVLTDLKMPDMSGWEVAKVVKARWPRLPVGIITGSPELLAERREPVELVIRKPVSLEALRAALSKLGA